MQRHGVLGIAILGWVLVPGPALAGGYIPDDILSAEPLWMVLPPVAITVIEFGLLRRFYRLDGWTAWVAAFWMNAVAFVVPYLVLMVIGLDGLVGRARHYLFSLDSISFALAKPWLTGETALSMLDGFPWGITLWYVGSRIIEYPVLVLVLGKGSRLDEVPLMPLILVNAIALAIYMVLLFCSLLFVEPYCLFDPAEL